MKSTARFCSLVATLALGFALTAHADEASIRKTFGQRLKDFPTIDEVKKMPIPGLYEVRAGTTIYYSDENGDHLLVGSIFDTKNAINLTEVRNKSLASLEFKNLPFSDAIKTVKGNGKRQLVVFADPNCGYCKELERQLVKIDNVTVHTFLFPILGPDSVMKSRDIFCAKDNNKVWTDWMISKKAIPTAPASCTAVALERNVALGRRMKVTGTPAMFFEDGKRVPGAADAQAIETQLQASSKGK